MIDRHANNDPRQPNTQRTITPEPLDSAIAAHKRFLNNILSIARIPRRRDRDLKQKRTMLPSSRFEIKFFCSNSYGPHPPVSVVMTALPMGEFEFISWPP